MTRAVEAAGAVVVVWLWPAPGIEVLDGGQRQQLEINIVQAGKERYAVSQERSNKLTSLTMKDIIRVILEPIVEAEADPMVRIAMVKKKVGC